MPTDQQSLPTPVISLLDDDRQTITSIRSNRVNGDYGPGVSTIVTRNLIGGRPPSLTTQSHVQNEPPPIPTPTMQQPIVDQEPHAPPPPPEMADDGNPENNLAGAPTAAIGISLRAISLHGSRVVNAERRRLSEKQLFEYFLLRGGSCYHLLRFSHASGHRNLRVIHMIMQNRMFGMLTCCLLDNDSTTADPQSNREQKRLPFGCVFWQTSSSPPRAVTITLSLQKLRHPDGFKIAASCSCEPSTLVTSIDFPSCDHIQSFFGNSNLFDLFKFSLEDFLNNGPSRELFAATLQPTDRFPVVRLVKDRTTTAEGTVQAVRSYKEPSFFTMFDLDRQMFVPMIKEWNKKIRCNFCRTHPSERGPCEHEICWENYNEENPEDIPPAFDPNEEVYEEEQEIGTILDDLESQTASRHRSPRPRTCPEILKYCRKDIRLPLLPCDGIQASSYCLAVQIERHTGNSPLQIEDLYGCCNHCGFRRKIDVMPPGQMRWRETKLFTLNHQICKVEVEDWICPGCLKLVYFGGVGRGNFPVRKSYCFTYELLYYFVHNVCRLGTSFRTQYDIYHSSQISQSAIAKAEMCNNRHYIDLEECSSGRRRCAEAFFYFIPCLDTSNPTMCKELFTCSTCEKALTDPEKKTLGFQSNHQAAENRFKAVVIDGTSAGILHALPKYERDAVRLNVPSALRRKKKFISNKIFQTAILKLIKILRIRLRLILSRSRSFPPTSRYFEMGIPLKGQGGKQRGKIQSMTKEELAFLRLYLGEEHCVCGHGTTNTRNNAFCSSTRTKFTSEVHGDDVRAFFKSVLFIYLKQQSNTGNSENAESTTSSQSSSGRRTGSESPEHTNGLSSSDAVGEQEEQEEEEEDGDDDDDVDEQEDDHADQEEQDEEAEDEDLIHDDGSENEHHNSDEEDEPDDAQEENENSDENRNELVYMLRLDIPNIQRHGQLIEALLDAMALLLTENASVPYVRPCGEKTITNYSAALRADDFEIRRRTLFKDTSILKIDDDVIGYDSFKVHRRLAESLDTFADCQCDEVADLHNVIQVDNGPCLTCREGVARYVAQCSEVNPIFSRFAGNLLLQTRWLKSRARSIAMGFADCIREQMDLAETYFNVLASKMSPSTKSYWNQYAGCNINKLHHTCDEEDGRITDRSPQTGVSFPGRVQYRPLFVFDKNEGHQCGKRYAKNSNHSPGLLTIQCACGNPKLIGFIIMTRCESTALALSIALMFFKIPPETIFYDNACNALLSALLRLPWLLLFSFLVVDRFHYKSHKCHSFYDADRFQRFDDIKTSSAESINGRIKTSLRSMRFLRGETLVHYLNIRFALLNLNAKYYEKFAKRDVEDVNLNKFYSSLVPCNCAVSQFETVLSNYENESDDDGDQEDMQHQEEQNDGHAIEDEQYVQEED